jgi:hypothetical protein
MTNGLLADFAALILATIAEMSGVGEGVGVGITGVGDGDGVAASPQLASSINVSINFLMFYLKFPSALQLVS